MRITSLPFGDPLATFQPFADDPVAALLDSAAVGDVRSRFSYLAVEPFSVITADERGVQVDGAQVDGDPFAVLQQALSRLRGGFEAHPAVPFRGGAVGYLAYEMGRHADRFPPLPADPFSVPEMVIGLYDCVIAFDHSARRAFLISTGQPETDPTRREARARAREAHVLQRLTQGAALPPLDWSVRGAWREEQSRADAERAVARVVDYIHAGDIFQANLTQRRLASRPAGLDDFMLYRRLRSISPAPFAAFLRCGPETSVLSASPERFLALDREGHVETRPIKGTMRRDPDPIRDAELAAALRTSVKDRAENLMIVDLMRNDLGRICELGSVAAPALMELETFASVHHLVSAVTGRLHAGRDAVDLLRVCFPGGSITGAPKIRAMEIIAELERRQRGVCFGSVVHIGFDGAMDSSIAIRTLVRHRDTLIAQAGGGIVADSLPAGEYEEALLKMRPLLQALTGEIS
ncbi:anthranilate synthase component I family protein [Pseudochelatococcus lubricantis]|uniref:anthranilate synthase component I family protein n=1 Tax=Pseudochelatococcus lubricantis TaxID=1538102 RepID=UPI0035EB9F92